MPVGMADYGETHLSPTPPLFDCPTSRRIGVDGFGFAQFILLLTIARSAQQRPIGPANL